MNKNDHLRIIINDYLQAVRDHADQADRLPVGSGRRRAVLREYYGCVTQAEQRLKDALPAIKEALSD